MGEAMKTWRERIVEARARGEFTENDKRDAWSWHTCAVAEQNHRMPGVVVWVEALGVRARPADQDLREWGSDFPWAVDNDEFDGAEHLLDQIEDRALELRRSATAPDARSPRGRA